MTKSSQPFMIMFLWCTHLYCKLKKNDGRYLWNALTKAKLDSLTNLWGQFCPAFKHCLLVWNEIWKYEWLFIRSLTQSTYPQPHKCFPIVFKKWIKWCKFCVYTDSNTRIYKWRENNSCIALCYKRYCLRTGAKKKQRGKKRGNRERRRKKREEWKEAQNAGPAICEAWGRIMLRVI